MRRIPALLLAVLAGPLAAAQVELTLDDGRTVTGRLVDEDTFTVQVEQVIPGSKKGMIKGTSTFERKHITKLTNLPSIEAEYDSRNATVADTAAAHLELAKWCLANALEVPAADHAKKTLALDPDNKEAVDLLTREKYHLVDGQWLSDADWLTATKQVRVGDKVVSADEAATLRAKQAQDQAAEDAQSSIAGIDKRLAANQAAIAEIDKKKTALQQELTAAQRQSRQQNQQQGGRRNQNNGVNGTGGQTDQPNTDQQALANEYQQQMAQLDAQKDKLTKERSHLQAQRTDAQKAIDAVKTGIQAAK